tara:strand:+ start:419 stop:568 length:150 start_codon:yes stop_codon:yes gene_type:complete
MLAISLGINERKNMFISVITDYTKVGVIYLDFNVTEKHSIVGEFPNFLL